AASSRIGVSRGIEALDADELEVLISLATAARTSSEIAVGENPHIDPTRAEAALPRLRELGLAWPTSGTGRSGASDTASVLAAHPVWRIQSEAITLLPTSAAESARARPWQIDPATVDASTATIAQPLSHNSDHPAGGDVIASLRALADERPAAPISRLPSAGIAKRDVPRLAGTLDLGLEQTITLLLAAKSLRLIGLLDDALDPQWTAADDADS